MERSSVGGRGTVSTEVSQCWWKNNDGVFVWLCVRGQRERGMMEHERQKVSEQAACCDVLGGRERGLTFHVPLLNANKIHPSLCKNKDFLIDHLN